MDTRLYDVFTTLYKYLSITVLRASDIGRVLVDITGCIIQMH